MARTGKTANRTNRPARSDTVYQQSLKSANGRFLPVSLFESPGKLRWHQRYIVVVMILMGWSASATPAERFRQARASLVKMFAGRKRPGKTYQGLVEAVLHRGTPLLEKVKDQLRRSVRPASGDAWEFKGLVPLGVDGSKAECPKTFNNELAFG